MNMVGTNASGWLKAKADQGMTYAQYRVLVDEAVKKGLTTGDQQTPELSRYTVLNKARMDRMDRTVKLDPVLMETLHQAPEQVWLVLTEGWCGDAAQNIPALAAMAAAAPQITLSLLLRDAHPDLMDRYLTGASRSIPKLIAFDPDGNELFVWGPRPDPAQRLIMDNKALPVAEQIPYSEISAQLHAWYAKDRTAALQQEMLALLSRDHTVAAMAGAKRS